MDMPQACKRAVTLIVTKHIFFASTLLRHPIEFTRSTPTAHVTHDGHIAINPDWSADFTAGHFVFLLCHECWHIMGAHALRRGNRDAKRWNWAGDAWINESLIMESIGTFIEGGIRHDGAQHMTVEQLYAKAPDDPPGGGGGALGEDLEVVKPGAMTQEEVQAKIAEADQELARAAAAAKMMGNLPASIEQLVNRTLHSQTPWHKYLEEFMTRTVEDDYAFHKPDETFRHLGLFIPGLDGTGCGKLAIVVDESGSIGDRVLEHFAGHLNRILAMCEPEEIYVLHTDTQVAKVETFTPYELPIKLTAHARGGTNMAAGVQHAVNNYHDLDAVVVLTDGYTPWGSDPGVPVFWAITTPRISAPYGQSVYVEAA